MDGLDEHEFQWNSPLRNIFCSSAISQETKLLTAEIQYGFDIIITSCSYAYEHINENLLAAKWEIAGFTEERQMEFVYLRCCTEIGRRRAAEYLKNFPVSREIGQIPLFLMVVHAAAIKGQPESGKTTLVKKLTYDSSKQKSCEETKSISYDIILVFPLKSIKSNTDLLEMAVGYYTGRTPNWNTEKKGTAALRQSNFRVQF